MFLLEQGLLFSDFFCPLAFGSFPHPYQCDAFYQCDEGQATQMVSIYLLCPIIQVPPALY